MQSLIVTFATISTAVALACVLVIRMSAKRKRLGASVDSEHSTHPSVKAGVTNPKSKPSLSRPELLTISELPKLKLETINLIREIKPLFSEIKPFSIRSFVIDKMVARNAKLDRTELEKLGNDALVEAAKRECPEDKVTVEMLDGKFPDLSIRSSAPYSKGSSDRAMIVSRRR